MELLRKPEFSIKLMSRKLIYVINVAFGYEKNHAAQRHRFCPKKTSTLPKVQAPPPPPEYQMDRAFFYFYPYVNRQNTINAST